MTSGATFAMGDANRDGAVNLIDYNLWKTTLGQVFPGGGSLGAAHDKHRRRHSQPFASRRSIRSPSNSASRLSDSASRICN